jgi:putative endonuclease
MFGKNKSKSIGNYGEKIAGRYLEKMGYKIVEFNYQNKTGRRLGEIDIIARKNGKIIFVEVKSRISDGKSVILPEENITRNKLYKLQKIAQVYIREKKLWDYDYQFDAVVILFSVDGKTVLEERYLENIFY